MNHLKILIIDDDEVDRVYYKKMLAGNAVFSCDLTESTDSKNALEVCENKKFDCILLDYLLPDMNGIEFVKTLKNVSAQLMPIVMLTGQGDENIAVAAMKEGVTDYIVKNQVNPHNLLKTIIKAIEKNELDTKNQLQKEKLKQYAYYDNVTDVLNRHAFADIAIRAISNAKRHAQLLAILYIDLDNFKMINDTFGHPAGDEVLKEAAKRITQNLRKEDVVARLGGDEFAVLLTGMKKIDDAKVVADKILKEINQPFQLDTKNIFINSSIGVADYPASGQTLAELLKNSDIALYRAKELGRGNFQFYTEEIKNIHEQRVFIEHALQSAISKQEFFLVYQPQFALSSKKLIGMEVLLRWQHPQLGIITPDKFIPIAEESGSIFQIGEWVIKTACAQLMEWQTLCHDESLSIAINISSRQITNQHFVKSIGNIIDSLKISPQCIELEMTESAIMRIQSQSVFEDLRALSLRLIIDDFGKGYSSFERLKQLPVDALKIDSSFVRDIGHKKTDAAVVKSIISIGKELGFGIIAEGIETESQLNYLIEQNCPFGQGFYFSKPLRTDNMTEFLLQNKER